MELGDGLRLIHPALAVLLVFPLIGIVVNRAWLTRTRRLETASGQKSKVPPIVGSEHVGLGRWLTGAVIGVTLIGLVHPISQNILNRQLWLRDPFQLSFIVLILVATIASITLLLRARPKLWRGIFATLTGMGIIILGSQDGVFRRTNEWYVSHYYYGITAALLMVCAVAIAPEIYRDRSNRWRKVHIALSCVALLLFMGQGLTGVRDLLEIPLGWQAPHLYKCDFSNKTCP